MLWRFAFGLTLIALAAKAEDPQRTAICEITRNPGAFDHKLIEVTGFASLAFEGFNLFNLECPGNDFIWIEYGGTRSSPAIFVGGPGPNKKRRADLRVEGIPIPLGVDAKFNEFIA
jgi:hypothetical protein